MKTYAKKRKKRLRIRNSQYPKSTAKRELGQEIPNSQVLTRRMTAKERRLVGKSWNKKDNKILRNKWVIRLGRRKLSRKRPDNEVTKH